MANNTKKVRIKGENSDFRWTGSLQEGNIKVIDDPEDAYMKIFICPDGQPSWLQPPLSGTLNRCEGTHWECPKGVQPIGHALITLSEHKGIGLDTDGNNYVTLDQEGNIHLGAGQSVYRPTEGQIELRSKCIRFLRRYRQDIHIFQPKPEGPYILEKKLLEGTLVCIARFVNNEEAFPLEREIKEGFQVDYDLNTITITDPSLYEAERITLEFGLPPLLSFNTDDEGITLTFENGSVISTIKYKGNDIIITPSDTGTVIINGNIRVNGDIEYTGRCSDIQLNPK